MSIWLSSDLKFKVLGIYTTLLNVNRELGFFIMFSAFSGIIENKGQAAYGATSTFLDSCTRYWRQLGLSATSIDLRPIRGIGYVSEHPERRVLERLFPSIITEIQFFALLKAAITETHLKSCDHQT